MGSTPIPSFLISKQSWMYVTDSTNIRWLRTFHLYKGFHRKTTYPGLFIKGSARIVEPPRIVYKGFKYKYYIKGNICRMLIIRTFRRIYKKDRTATVIQSNSGIIIKKKQDPKSKYLTGVVSNSINKKKLKTLFRRVV